MNNIHVAVNFEKATTNSKNRFCNGLEVLLNRVMTKFFIAPNISVLK